ncbi:omega-amidase, chloroplastic-like protein isoform X1 [Tanacetum coccineum]
MSSSSASKSSWGANITRKKQFKIGLCQLTVSPEKKTNLASARKSIEFAAKQGAALVVLPEMWNCPYSSDNFAKFAEDFKDKHGSPSFFMLSELASCHNITIVGGSVPELDNDRLYNTCCVFGSNGKLLAKHRKLHLFDVENPAPGELSFKESDCFAAGSETTVVDTDACRIGIGICHDIRFPELAMATDNQIYIATCSPSRSSSGSYEIWGHSTLVSPGGEVVGKLEHEEGVLIAEIDLSAINHQRQCIPLQKQRRHDIYKLLQVLSGSKHEHGVVALDASNATITLEEIDGFLILSLMYCLDLVSPVIWGHSTLVSPGGEVVGQLEHEEGVLIAEIDLSAINHQRQCIPLQKHRRHDMYRLLQVEEQTP